MEKISKTKRLPQSMKDQEYLCIKDLLEKFQPKNTLEVGMANGGSTIVFCEYIRSKGAGRHTAIDPFQSSAKGSSGFGLNRIKEAGLLDVLDFHENFDYLVLPKLVEENRKFDFILIDGWHSFDYTLVDLFFADLLLNPNGILVFHDTELDSVNKACRFLESHKPYDRISPDLYLRSESLVKRGANKIRRALSGAEALKAAEERRTKWFSLGAYQKKEDHQVANTFYSDF